MAARVHRRRRRRSPFARALRSTYISSGRSPDADGRPTFRIRWRSISEHKELQHLQRIAAWAGASVLHQALLLGTGAICYHGTDVGVEAYRLAKSGRTTGK